MNIKAVQALGLPYIMADMALLTARYLEVFSMDLRQMIIHDELSAGLDIRSRRRLISILQNSAQTMLIASHDLELVLEVCARVVLMDQGRIVADGGPSGDHGRRGVDGHPRPGKTSLPRAAPGSAPPLNPTRYAHANTEGM